MMSIPSGSNNNINNRSDSNAPSFSSTPNIMTPSGTPPPNVPAHVVSSFDTRLNELLKNFDMGTHSFCREERETPEEKVSKWGEPLHKMQPVRKPSQGFLSALSLSRPHTPLSQPPQQPTSGSANSSNNSTPLNTPGLGGSFPRHHNTGLLQMTSMDQPSTEVAPTPGNLQRSSTEPISSLVTKSSSMQRAKSVDAGKANSPTKYLGGGGRRFSTNHFDPSKEPKLLGLL